MPSRSAHETCSGHGKALKIEVVFALPERQELISLTLDAGTTVETAISVSGIGDRFPEEDLSTYQVGIWGRIVNRDHPLENGDRLELYRPLSMDPRDARRKLAARGLSMGARIDDASPKIRRDRPR